MSIPAHRTILSAHSEVFRAMLKPESMREGETGVVELPNYEEGTVKRLLQYFYCNKINEMGDCSLEEIIELIRMADQYLILPLKEWCLKVVSCDFFTIENVPKLLEEMACVDTPVFNKELTHFIVENGAEMMAVKEFEERVVQEFKERVVQSPNLMLEMIMKLQAGQSPEDPRPFRKED